MICILNYLLSISINIQGTPLAIENTANGALTGDNISLVPDLVSKGVPVGQTKEASSSNLSPAGEQQGRSETLERQENPERH